VDNLSSLKVAFGSDSTMSGNSTITTEMFVNPRTGDFRPKSLIHGGAVPFGDKMFYFGAKGYRLQKKRTNLR
jgi:hypothetical protein